MLLMVVLCFSALLVEIEWSAEVGVQGSQTVHSC